MGGVITRALKKHHPLYDSLASIVGSRYVTDQDFAVYAYSRESSAYPPQIPGIIVLPANTEEVSEIVKLANQTLTPIIPSGGRASIHGNPPGVPNKSIVVDMTRMNKIIDIDEENMTVTAEAGIIINELYTELEKRGLHIETPAGPSYVVTLGGFIGGVYGGGLVRKFSTGVYNNHILGLTVVLPDGGILQTGGGPGRQMHINKTFARDVAGPDITGLFLGDSGIFGIKTEATLKIIPVLEFFKGGSYLFGSFDDLWRVQKGLMRIEPIPYYTVTGFHPRTTGRFCGEEAWSLLYRIEGYSQEEVDVKFKYLRKLVEEVEGTPGPMEMNETAIGYWGRSEVYGELLREFGNFITMGMWNWTEWIASIEDFPRIFLDIVEFMDKRYEEEGLDEYGCIRFDGYNPVERNYVYASTDIFFDDSIPECTKKVLKIGEEFKERVMKSGAFLGVGAGYHLWDSTAAYWSPVFHEFIRTLKKTLDPNNILNPGFYKLEGIKE